MGIRKLGGSDIKWSNPYGDQIMLAALKALMLITHATTIKTLEPHLMQVLLYVCHPPKKGKHNRVGCCCKAKSTNVN